MVPPGGLLPILSPVLHKLNPLIQDAQVHEPVTSEMKTMAGQVPGQVEIRQYLPVQQLLVLIHENPYVTYEMKDCADRVEPLLS